METRTLSLDVPDGTMPVYEAVPDGNQRGAVVVVQEAFGVNAHIEDVTRRLAEAGYHAVAPHLFHRTGSPAYGYEDIGEVMPNLLALSDDGILADVGSVLDHLRAAGWSDRRIGIVGFCMGGTVALIIDTERDLGAAVTFYGGGVREGRFGFPALVDAAPHLRAPWLGLFGDQDKGIPVDQVEDLRAAAAKSGQTTEVVRYPDADHGFHCDQRDSYHAEASRDGWARTLEFFGRYLAT